MNKIILILFLSTINIFSLNPEKVEIVNFRIYGKDQLDFPVAIKNSLEENIITIEFEIKSNFYPNLALLFKLCDQNWNPYHLGRFKSNYKNLYGPLKFDNLPIFVKKANYHFKESFDINDDQKLNLIFSGKWKVYILDFSDTSISYYEDKFYIAENNQIVKAKISAGRILDPNIFPVELQRTLTIEFGFFLKKEFQAQNVSFVEIVRNREIDNSIILSKNLSKYQDYFYDGNRRFKFAIKNIKPRNAYRQIDITDANIYPGPEITFRKEGIDLNDFYKRRKIDNKGGSILLDYKNKNSDYLLVDFKLRADEFSKRKIYIVGAFNSWKISDEYLMEEQNENGLFSKKIWLKRGVYDYQYVAELNDGNTVYLDWEVLEGNYWETSVDYRIFLFYSDPDNYNVQRIIGYLKINSEGL